MTFQPEERFILTMRELKDVYGNMINTNPKTITLVQRIDKPVAPPPDEETEEETLEETLEENLETPDTKTEPAITPENPDYYK